MGPKVLAAAAAVFLVLSVVSVVVGLAQSGDESEFKGWLTLAVLSLVVSGCAIAGVVGRGH